MLLLRRRRCLVLLRWWRLMLLRRDLLLRCRSRLPLWRGLLRRSLHLRRGLRPGGLDRGHGPGAAFLLLR